jgi:hypothetical protein
VEVKLGETMISVLDSLGSDAYNPETLRREIRRLEKELAERPPASPVIRMLTKPPIEAEGRFLDECVPG